MNDGLPLLQTAGIALGFPVAAFVFGWSLLRHVRDLDAEERFAASWGVSFAFLAFTEFLAFLTGAGQTAFHLGTLVVMALVAAAGFLRKNEGICTTSPDFRRMVGLCALGYVHLVCIQMLLPIYVGGNWFGDWWMHYDEALVFRGERGVETEWFGLYTLASRTPPLQPRRSFSPVARRQSLLGLPARLNAAQLVLRLCALPGAARPVWSRGRAGSESCWRR